MARNIPLRIYCKNCGAPVGFDIEKQTYRCSSCGEVTGIEENHNHVFKWRELQQEDLSREQVPAADYVECTGCGARVLFKEGEASSQCDFCGGNLVRKEFTQDKNMPELIIPFVLKEEEAKQRLQEWCKNNSKRKEARRLEQHIKNIEGYYLPYRLVRGPITADVVRDGMGYKKYHCRGFSEGTAVNTSKQLDNDVLDAAEPFDWSAAQPFSYAYIGGLPVKLNDLSDKDISRRMLAEIGTAYRPDISEALHSNDVDITVQAGNMLNIPALLPMYIVRDGKFQAVVNGQTGRVAVMTLEKAKNAESKLWMAEPIIIWLLIMAATLYYIPEAIFHAGAIFGLLLWALYEGTKNGVMIKKHLQGEETNAFRSEGKLVLEKGKDVLKNLFPNKPIFYEMVNGKDTPVEISFYSPWRIVIMLFNLFIAVFLPAVIAFALSMLGVGDKPELEYQYGAAWYIIGGFLAFLYYIRGIRQGLFSHPILHAIMPDGTRVKIKDAANIGIMSVFYDAGGAEGFSDWWSGLKEMGCLLWFMIGTLLFILMGSVGAILY